MDSGYKLSDVEYELMQLFWRAEEPLKFSDVLAYCNGEKGHNWAKTTIHTYLTQLIREDVLASTRNGYKRSYFAKVSEEELSHMRAAKFVEDAYNGSLKHLLLSLTYKTKLSDEEVAELHALLDSQLSKNDGGGE